MPVNKLQRFTQIKEMNHVFEYTDYRTEEIKKPKGRWHEEIFGNTNPITLELGCGKGTYTTSLAGLHPDNNYIGIDIKGARLWKGAKRATAEQLNNVRFLRIYIESLTEYFADDEVSELWITFPGPYPRAGDRDKRLTSPRFLRMYRRILQPQGVVHFKTDDDDLLKYTLQTIKATGGKILKCVKDIYAEEIDDDLVLKIQTDFEKRHLEEDKTIKYCKFQVR